MYLNVILEIFLFYFFIKLQFTKGLFVRGIYIHKKKTVFKKFKLWKITKQIKSLKI